MLTPPFLSHPAEPLKALEKELELEKERILGPAPKVGAVSGSKQLITLDYSSFSLRPTLLIISQVSMFL